MAITIIKSKLRISCVCCSLVIGSHISASIEHEKNVSICQEIFVRKTFDFSNWINWMNHILLQYRFSIWFLSPPNAINSGRQVEKTKTPFPFSNSLFISISWNIHHQIGIPLDVLWTLNSQVNFSIYFEQFSRQTKTRYFAKLLRKMIKIIYVFGIAVRKLARTLSTWITVWKLRVPFSISKRLKTYFWLLVCGTHTYGNKTKSSPFYYYLLENFKASVLYFTTEKRLVIQMPSPIMK